VSSENSAKAPTEKHSFDGKKSLLTDDDVQRLAMAVKNLMLDDLRVKFGVNFWNFTD
jgi:hypothetical protein